jgi:hypothetical protein
VCFHTVQNLYFFCIHYMNQTFFRSGRPVRLYRFCEGLPHHPYAHLCAQEHKQILVCIYLVDTADTDRQNNKSNKNKILVDQYVIFNDRSTC